MPVASVSTESVKKELKTLEGGFVELKRMPYGAWLKRQEMAMQLKFNAAKGGDTAGEIAMANKAVTVFEFSQCIVDHNLEITEGTPFDFRQETSLDRLDPKVGNEIASYITEMHEFDLPNSLSESNGV